MAFPKKLVAALLPAKLKLRLKCRRIDGDLHLRVQDRIDLEEEIIPHFVDTFCPTRVLDIGCDWYSQWYARLFPNAEYWTLDIDPEKAQYGAGERHRVCSLTEASQSFPSDKRFDLVVCNGVFGWGLFDEAAVSTAVAQIAALIEPDGHLIVGWNDQPERLPALIPSGKLDGFTPYSFPGRGARWDTHTTHRHLFDFYQRV